MGADHTLAELDTKAAFLVPAVVHNIAVEVADHTFVAVVAAHTVAEEAVHIAAEVVAHTVVDDLQIQRVLVDPDFQIRLRAQHFEQHYIHMDCKFHAVVH